MTLLTGIGSRVAPGRFVAFVAALMIAWPVAAYWLGVREGLLAAFDGAALLFLAICVPLLNDGDAEMRQAAARNDANRATVLLLTGVVTIVLLVAVGSELAGSGEPSAMQIGLVIATLLLAWLFSNTVYALHYGHMYYTRQTSADGGDTGGLRFDDTETPDYADFLYFAFTLGMTFQTSDVTICSRQMRRAALVQGLGAFLFNIGVVAFSVNVLGS